MLCCDCLFASRNIPKFFPPNSPFYDYCYIFFPFCNYYEKKKTSNKIKCRNHTDVSFFGLDFPVSMGPIMVIVKMSIIDFSASGQ